MALPLSSVQVFIAPPSDRRLPRAVGSAFDAEAARRAAHGERIERFSQLFRPGDVSATATLRRMGARAVHPHDCQLFSARQYRERRRWNARRQPACEVPHPFDARRLTDWTSVRSLTDNAERFVATGVVCYNAVVAGGDACIADSTGSASATTFDDAVVRGFLEVVERDAIALWWYHRMRPPAFDVRALDDAPVRALRAELLELGVELELLDLTSDLAVPVCAAVARPFTSRGRVFVGFGCHFEPHLAARRAAAEMTQAYALGAWIADAPFLRSGGQAPPGRPVAPRAAHLQRCIDVARGLGLQLLVADLTRPDVGVPVVKVLVPGLRPAQPRFAPGRLFDVLRRNGRRVAERDLNPVPFVL